MRTLMSAAFAAVTSFSRWVRLSACPTESSSTSQDARRPMWCAGSWPTTRPRCIRAPMRWWSPPPSTLRASARASRGRP